MGNDQEIMTINEKTRCETLKIMLSCGCGAHLPKSASSKKKTRDVQINYKSDANTDPKPLENQLKLNPKNDAGEHKNTSLNKNVSKCQIGIWEPFA